MPELAQWMIDGGATFFDAAGNPTRPDGTPVIDTGGRGGGPTGVLGQVAQQVGAPQAWQAWQPPELTQSTPEQEGRGGPPIQEQPTQQQQAMLGHFGEAAQEQAGQSLLDYVASRAGELPADPSATSWGGATMTPQAQAFLKRQNLPIDPNRIVYNGEGGFRLDDWVGGADPFFGQLNPQYMNLNEMPRALQPLLGPAIAAYYGAPYDLVARGGAPPWTSFFAPPGNQLSSSSDKLWPGITHYDAWHRSLGEWANLYS